MTKYAFILLPSAALLASCGNMADSDEMVKAFGDSCKESFAAEGGPAELAEPFCDCSVEKAKEQELGPMDMLDEDKMMELGEQCAAEIMAGVGAEGAAAAE